MWILTTRPNIFLKCLFTFFKNSEKYLPYFQNEVYQKYFKCMQHFYIKLFLFIIILFWSKYFKQKTIANICLVVVHFHRYPFCLQMPFRDKLTLPNSWFLNLTSNSLYPAGFLPISQNWHFKNQTTFSFLTKQTFTSSFTANYSYPTTLVC